MLLKAPPAILVFFFEPHDSSEVQKAVEDVVRVSVLCRSCLQVTVLLMPAPMVPKRFWEREKVNPPVTDQTCNAAVVCSVRRILARTGVVCCSLLVLRPSVPPLPSIADSPAQRRLLSRKVPVLWWWCRWWYKRKNNSCCITEIPAPSQQSSINK
ncbi:hypothetical protein FA15DRAFT_462801 [Coprinopsis marcescibilis]|uniref:Uncharacterized protein n=1 Tax=Coprinopsis marcescibilis TaxID=230819 RepID=A0A5C3L5L4_COPMA|nr:hypothetical protein FA15DRAFT_462801 [Coprinopsis marcescibilis]